MKNRNRISFIAVIGLFLICSAVQARAQASLTPDDLVKQGDYLYKQNKFQEAIGYYKMAIDHEPYNDHALGYIGYAYHKLNDKSNARIWMKRRAEVPGLSPSVKAQVLTDVTLLYWDEADMELRSRVAGGSDTRIKPEEAASISKLVVEGIDSAQKVVAIAPRSVKGFNLLNLLYRVEASLDPANQKELVGRADEALRKALAIVQANPPAQPQTDVFAIPTVSITDGASQDSPVKVGAVSSKASIEGESGASAVVEVFVGGDGKVKFTRFMKGDNKVAQAAAAAARKYKFEASTFDGQPIQIIRIISFPDKS